jgi:uncharacterized heparinase superfamily protein
VTAFAGQALRYWHTVRFLRPTQVTARLRLRSAAAGRQLWPGVARYAYRWRGRASGLRIAARPLGLSGAEAKRQAMSPGQRAVLGARVQEMESGTFNFLNLRVDLGCPIPWCTQVQSQLWRYQLHYFDYLVDFVLGCDDPWARISPLLESWIAACPLGAVDARDAWHPYVVSVRVVNWMLAVASTAGQAEPADSVQRSLVEQTIFVEHNLEHDVGGNHLLKNLKALVFAGCFFEGPVADRWREQYCERFAQELDAQLLADGGHYERSPMYHGLVMADLLEVIAFLHARERAIPATLTSLARRMNEFLIRVTHPDGQIALFNDSVFGVAPAPAELRAFMDVLLSARRSGPLTPRHDLMSRRAGRPHTPVRVVEGEKLPDKRAGREESGYVVLANRDRSNCLIADAGAVCPDDLPAHAHADLLSFEASVGGVRLIVDSGVAEYAAGPWREYFRSVRAHNTVMVDGMDQSDCWGSFRVARRARPCDVTVRVDGRICGLDAAHTGYVRNSSPVRHRRRIAFVDERFWLIVDDLFGEGEHQWEGYVHLHPGTVTSFSQPSTLRAARASVHLAVVWCGPVTADLVCGAMDPLQGWYAQEFGRREEAPTLVLRGSGQLPVQFGCVLLPVDPGDLETITLNTDSHDRSVVGVGETRLSITLATGEPWLVETSHQSQIADF